MKYRVFHNLVRNRFVVQYKWLGLFWRNSIQRWSRHEFTCIKPIEFESKEEAVWWIERERTYSFEKKELKLSHKKKLKESKVVYEMEF